MKLIKQQIGKKIVLGAGGDNFERLVYQSYSFFNFGATNQGCSWARDVGGFPIVCYCWTTPKMLEKYFYQSSLALAHQKGHNKPSDEVINGVTGQRKRQIQNVNIV